MRRHRKSIWLNGFAAVGISSAAGIGAMMLSTALFSAITYFFIGSMDFSAVFAAASTVLGGYISGRICGRYRRRSGLAEGALCGLAIYAVISLCGIISGIGISGIKKLLLLCISGAVGGVTGVNSKRPKNLMN